jgi:hypothetical protein
MFYQGKPVLFVCVFLLLAHFSMAQGKRLSGVVKDKQSDEPIPFASVEFKLSKKGVLTDSAGKCRINPIKEYR